MRLDKMLGIKYPFIQGGMANIATGEFAAAVSNAGGLGLIGAGGMNTDMLRENIRKCRTLTDKPFGVNLMLMNPEADAMAELLVEENVKIVTTGAGSPAKYMEKWKSNGMMVIPVVSSAALAIRMERCGRRNCRWQTACSSICTWCGRCTDGNLSSGKYRVSYT